MRVLVLNSGSSSVKYQLVDSDTGERLAGGVVEEVVDHAAALDEVVAVVDRRPSVSASRSKRWGTVWSTVGTCSPNRRSSTTRSSPPCVRSCRWRRCTTRPTSPGSRRPGRTGRRWPRWPCSTRRSTGPCRRPPTDTPCPSRGSSTTACAATGSTAPRTTTCRPRAADLLGRPRSELDLIVAHLGNGASITAVQGGRSVETSMGLSPLEGLVMGTRSGDIDPAVIGHVAAADRRSEADVLAELNRASGLLGLCGDSDMRAIVDRIDAGDEVADLALDVFCHRIRKYVGAYVAVLGGCDAVVFTAGIGEHSALVRSRVCAGLEVFGLSVDEGRNERSDVVISPDGAASAVLVVPTDEEHAIAEQTARGGRCPLSRLRTSHDQCANRPGSAGRERHSIYAGHRRRHVCQAPLHHSAHTTSTGWKNRRTKRAVSVSRPKASVPSTHWAMLPGKITTKKPPRPSRPGPPRRRTRTSARPSAISTTPDTSTTTSASTGTSRGPGPGTPRAGW